MKKIFEKFATLAAMLLVLPIMFGACSKEDIIDKDDDKDDNEEVYDYWIVDYSPVEFRVYVEDKDGDDLLNPDFERNVFEGVKVIRNGKEYPMTERWGNTRMYAPVFYGVVNMREDKSYDYYTHVESDLYILLVGEFDGAPGSEGEATLYLGDGTTVELAYISEKGEQDEHGIVRSIRRFWVNGEEQETSNVKIVL